MATYQLLATAFTDGTVTGPVSTNGSGGSGAINTTGATLLVAYVSILTGSQPIISDSQGNTWPAPAAGNDVPATGTRTVIWLLRSPTTSASHTFTLSKSAGPDLVGSLMVLAFSGDLPVTLIDAAASNSVASGATSLASGSVTPTQNNDLVLSFLAAGSGAGVAINGGFTIARSYPGQVSVAYAGAIAYLLQTTPTAANPTWSWTGASGANTFTLAIRSGDTNLPASGPTINTQPSNASVTAPATASFSVSATASAGSLTYQWQVSTNSGSTWANVTDGTGATSASYTTSATAVSTGNHRNGYQYRCAVTDSNGTVNSNAATLTVTVPSATSMTIALKQSDGTTAAASITGIEYAILNAATLGAATAVLDTGTGESTDGSGNLVLDLTGLGLTAGQVRYVIAGKSSGTVGANFDGWHGPATAA